MNRIHPQKLRDLLRNRLYAAHIGVVASIGGGWFVRVPS